MRYIHSQAAAFTQPDATRRGGITDSSGTRRKNMADEEEEVVDPKLAADAKCLATTECAKALVRRCFRPWSHVRALMPLMPHTGGI